MPAIRIAPTSSISRNLLRKFTFGGRLNLFKDDQDMPDSEVTLDYVLDRLVIHGDPSSVVDQLLEFREVTGPFGHLVYAGPGLDRLRPRP